MNAELEILEIAKQIITSRKSRGSAVGNLSDLIKSVQGLVEGENVQQEEKCSTPVQVAQQVAQKPVQVGQAHAVHDDNQVEKSYLPHRYKNSVFENYLICLETGKKFVFLKSQLKRLGMTHGEYLRKHDLPNDYPIAPPGFARRMRNTRRKTRLAKNSIGDNYIICLLDNVKVKYLRRYIEEKHNMSVEDYLEKFNLPDDYPMTAKPRNAAA